jgi:hypothetical protein
MLMAWKKASALLFAVGFALYVTGLHTHVEAPTLPGSRDTPQVSQGAVAAIAIWAEDSLQLPMTNRPAIAFQPTWAQAGNGY